MDSFPHVATLSAIDCERVTFALRLVNLDASESCICTDFDDPNDHREDCPHWGRDEGFFREEAFEELAASIEAQSNASRIVTALSLEAASWVVTALDKLAIQERDEGHDRESRFLTVIATLFSAAERITREMPIPSQKDEPVLLDPTTRIADALELGVSEITRAIKVVEAIAKSDPSTKEFLQRLEAEQHSVPGSP